MDDAPIPLELTNAMTVSDCQKVVPSVCVDRIVTFVSCAAATVVQISEVPCDVLARPTRVHVNPTVETVTVWAAVAGPSEATNATSRRFVPAVEKTRLRTPC